LRSPSSGDSGRITPDLFDPCPPLAHTSLMRSVSYTGDVIVGQAREQARLAELVHAAVEGSGAVLMIGGEAGIGKSGLRA
jgi:hypothetical protein